MPIPIVSVKQMRDWEQSSWDAGRREADVIEQVGRALAARLLALTAETDSILFLAGKGHNGDDARAAARALRNLREHSLIAVTSSKQSKRVSAALKNHQWVVDGLFGIGLNRPLDAGWQRMIGAINDAGIPIIAIDTPSGLNADTGKPEGASIKATITLTVGAPKRGLLLAPEYVGRLEVLRDIGLVECNCQAELHWTDALDFENFPPPRPLESNKGTYGHAAIIAGSAGYHGAAVLASHGALRARPGLVSVYPQPKVYVPVATQSQAAMVHAYVGKLNLPKGCTSILAGPGMADPKLPAAVKTQIRALWKTSPCAMVADASALDWLPPGVLQGDVIRVITPHPGEAGRMLGSNASDVQRDRVGALKALSKKFGNCYVVLKGHQTLVGQSTGKIFVNSSGNPGLAQGGSGDLLGGYLAGLLAQMRLREDVLKTIRYGVWQHGAAADVLEAVQKNWTIEDVSSFLGLA